MLKYLKRFGAALVASVAVLAGGLAVATPAQAAQGCPAQSFCLYQNVQFNGERWQTSLTNIYYHPNNCLSIPPARWANGTPVYDNSASLVLENDVDTSPWIYYNVYVHQWSNCNPGGGVRALTGRVYEWPDLNNYNWNGILISMYHNISSVELIPKGSPLDQQRQRQAAESAGKRK